MVDRIFPICYNNGMLSKKEPSMLELQCSNVPGGWQTCIKNTQVHFGPVFNRIQDLWMWQKNNIYAVQQNGWPEFPDLL